MPCHLRSANLAQCESKLPKVSVRVKTKESIHIGVKNTQSIHIQESKLPTLVPSSSPLVSIGRQLIFCGLIYQSS